MPTAKTSYTDRQRVRTGRKPITDQTIAVLGLGYVGLPLALLAHTRVQRVIGVDIKLQHIINIANRIAPDFLTEAEQAQFPRHTIEVTTDTSLVGEADVVIVCVPTPVTKNYFPDLQPLIKACQSIAAKMRPGTLVVVESTVNPGVCEEVVLPILTGEGSAFTLGEDLFFAYCPERINPGDTAWPVDKIPRVIGTSDPISHEWAVALYEHLIDAPVMAMGNIKEAEAVKITENSFRDINIAFVNELAMSFDTLGIDITAVLKGAATKPFAFMAHYPGCGVGGHCIPVDPYYLIAYAKKNGFTHRFLQAARDINNHMPSYTVDVLEKCLAAKHKSVAGSHVALLGLAYKPEVSDVRESPALKIAAELKRRGAFVRPFDPFVPAQSYAGTLKDTLHNADAAIIATAHTMFCSLTAQDFAKHNVDIVVDGRNCLSRDSFENTTITYHGIGTG